MRPPRLTCVHEAGHCVVAMAVGGEVFRVEARTDGTGATDYLRDGLSPVERAAVAFAGPLAEINLCGVAAVEAFHGGGRIDLGRVDALGIGPTDRARAMHVAGRVLDIHRPAVARLADRLERDGALDGETVALIVGPVFAPVVY